VNNKGDAIGAVQHGLEQIHQRFAEYGKTQNIARSMVTGYGEDLIHAAFGLDEGMVETLAHFRAAKAFDKDVSFIMDIGGQDMKAIFVRDGFIQDIKINGHVLQAVFLHRVVRAFDGITTTDLQKPRASRLAILAPVVLCS
jgi:activator of 2-hydroxyglutaryl-CoA dehydratase